jgi:outer membrane protein insertion porin family
MRKLLFVLAVLLIADNTIAQIRSSRTRPSTSGAELDYAAPKEFEIVQITVTGADFLDKNALISLSGLKVGDKIKIPGDDISQAIKKLWKHGIIGDASIILDKIENGQVYLVIELAERPRLSRMRFDGVNKTQEGDLKDKVKLILGKILTDADLKNIELNVKSYFIDKGFLNTDVEIFQEADSISANGVSLRIAVDKKSKIKINDINIEGNEEVYDTKLQNKMKNTHEKVRFTVFSQVANQVFNFNFRKAGAFVETTREVSGDELKAFMNENVRLNIFRSSKYKKSDYETDKRSIIDYYNSRGFRDAMIVEDTMYAHDDYSINIDITIDEGQKYYFRNITWSGNYVYSDQTLNNILGIEKGDIYDMSLVQTKLTFNPNGPDIQGLYMDDGYLFFNVQPTEVKIDNDSIDLEMRVFEGSQAIINKIIIKGNDRTNDHVILRELRTLPGRKFSRTDIIRTQQRLSQMGFFDPEQIGINPIPNPANGTVDIEYTLVEKPGDQIELSGGWGGSLGFIGTLGLVFNNFSLRNVPKFDKWKPLPFGDGQRVQIRAQANGRRFQNYVLAFTEPWLGGKKPNSFSVSLSRSIQRTYGEGATNSRDLNAKLTLTSIALGLGRALEWPDNYFTLSNTLEYTRYTLNNWPVTNFSSLGFSDGSSNKFALVTNISRYSVDQPLYPRSGSSISLAITLTPPYSSFNNISYQTAENEEKFKYVEFHKWMFDADYYINLAGKLVMATSIHFGVLGKYSKKAQIGPFERFQLGGDGLAGQNFILSTEIVGMRGYDNDAITPPFGQRELSPDDIRGGIIYNKYSMELRYPLTTGAAATIYFYLFGEAGNNWNNYQEYNPFDAYRSAGIGARLFMPAFGLIGINWGYGFDNVPGTVGRSGPQFQFTIGQQIR